MVLLSTINLSLVQSLLVNSVNQDLLINSLYTEPYDVSGATPHLNKRHIKASEANYSGHFELRDLTNGKGVFYVSNNTLNFSIKEDVSLY